MFKKPWVQLVLNLVLWAAGVMPFRYVHSRKVMKYLFAIGTACGQKLLYSCHVKKLTVHFAKGWLILFNLELVA